MSTGRPAAAEVASCSISAPSAATRSTSTATPVEVSLCGVAYTSTPSSALRYAAEPGSAVTTVGSDRCGAIRMAFANLEPNSPKLAVWALSSTRPKTATSQNAVVPPTPRTTS